MCSSCRGSERDPDHAHVGGQHSTEAAGGKVQKWRSPADPLQRHIWCVFVSVRLQACFLDLKQIKRTNKQKNLPLSNPTLFWPLLSDAFSQIIANEGVTTLWNGILPSLVLVFNPAVQFMFYEAMKRKAGKGGRKVRAYGRRKWCFGTNTIKSDLPFPCALRFDHFLKGFSKFLHDYIWILLVHCFLLFSIRWVQVSQQ